VNPFFARSQRAPPFVGLASRFRAPLSIAYRYCELRLRMTAISDGLETAANRPWRKRRSAPFVRSGRDQSTDDPFGSPLPPLSGQTNRTRCKCRGVAANDLPRVTGSSEQKSSTNFAPEAHMRIRLDIRQEGPHLFCGTIGRSYLRELCTRLSCCGYCCFRGH
jgi:hypothetical protein